MIQLQKNFSLDMIDILLSAFWRLPYEPLDNLHALHKTKVQDLVHKESK